MDTTEFQRQEAQQMTAKRRTASPINVPRYAVETAARLVDPWWDQPNKRAPVATIAERIGMTRKQLYRIHAERGGLLSAAEADEVATYLLRSAWQVWPEFADWVPDEAECLQAERRVARRSASR